MDKLLGKKAMDKITGFKGIIIGKCEYLYGCNQYGITPMAKDGKIEETRWFDEGRVDVVGEGYSPESVLLRINTKHWKNIGKIAP